MRLRGLLSTTSAVLVLALTQPAPARADLSFGELKDGLEDVLLGPIEDLIAMVKVIITEARNLPGETIEANVDAVLEAIGAAVHGYLGTDDVRAAMEDLLPDEPAIFTLEAAAAYADDRLDDRKDRIDEAMTVATRFVEQMPSARAKVMALSAANRGPVGVLAAQQIGNEALFELAETQHKAAAILAEFMHLEADQRAKEDWDAVQADRWMREHFGDAGYWSGRRSWTPDVIDMGY